MTQVVGETKIEEKLVPRIVTLRDGSAGTIFPFFKGEGISDKVLTQLRMMFNAEIESGQGYANDVPFTDNEAFAQIWTAKFCAVLVEGAGKQIIDPQDILGTFYIKPNYIGRCSHVCNGGFLVDPRSRGKGVGRTMGEAYLVWAPQLGYTYSVFNLVFETNVASQRIWEALGFNRIGRIPGAGRLKGIPGVVDAIMYGKQLVSDDELAKIHLSAD